MLPRDGFVDVVDAQNLMADRTLDEVDEAKAH